MDTSTPVFYRSALPSGYAVVPRRVSENRVVAVAPSVINRDPVGYEVPLLNVGTFGDTEREVKMKFGGELNGLEAKAYIKRSKGIISWYVPLCRACSTIIPIQFLLRIITQMLIRMRSSITPKAISCPAKASIVVTSACTRMAWRTVPNQA